MRMATMGSRTVMIGRERESDPAWKALWFTSKPTRLVIAST